MSATVLKPGSTTHVDLDVQLTGPLAAPVESASIMMIDDEPLMMDVVEGLLSDVGYRRFLKLDDPRQGIALLKSEQPDVLLLDLNMPHVSGFDLLKTMRGDPVLQFVPVIVLTSSTGADSKLKALELGATDFLGKPVDPSELLLRLRNTLSAKAYRDHLAFTDTATGLKNQRWFKRELVRLLEECTDVQAAGLCVLTIGLERFKPIAESLGPRVSDRVLELVGKRLLQTASRVGADDCDIRIARLDADEFALSCNGNIDHGARIAAKIIKDVSGTYRVEGHEVHVEARIGVCSFPDDAADAEELLQRSAAALGAARLSGNEPVRHFTPEVNERVALRLRREALLRRAIETDELSVFYQPKVDVASGSVVGAEALLRWHSRELGFISPADFIPIAEEAGMIPAIGHWVLEQVARQIAQWEDAGWRFGPVSVNVSGLQLSIRGFVEKSAEVVLAAGVDPSSIVLELTESVLMDRGEQALVELRRLSSAGFKISLDDFGTGYSSFAYLKDLPIDELKIDRSFLLDVNRKRDWEIVKAMVALGHSLDLNVVAEGVETSDQLEVLQACGCNQYQGFFFARPAPAEEFIKHVG